MIQLFGFTIRPEIERPMYWVHLLIIVFIVYGMIILFIQPMELNIKLVLLGVVFVAVGDIISHSILNLS